MVNITRDQLDRLYKKQKNSLTNCTAITTVCVILSISISRYNDGESAAVSLLCIILLFAAPLALVFYAKKKIIPPGNGKRVTEAMQSLQKDFISDRAVNMLYEKISRADGFAEKTRLILLLCDIYALRGQYREAIGMLNSVDRSQFKKYPAIGISFYDDTTSVYSELEDYDSVLLAYADAEPFIDYACQTNYLCASPAVNILIKVHFARKNYKAALDLRLMKNEFENLTMKMVTDQNGNTPLNNIIRGSVFCETAELFLRCGDIENAAKYLDIGGPMVAGSPAALAHANKLSAEIRDIKAQKS